MMIKQQTLIVKPAQTSNLLALVPVTTLGLAGLIHLAIAPYHYTHAPVHALFFGLIGVG
jgi:hypothetical protein